MMFARAVPEGLADAEVVVGIPRIGLRQLERADNFADDVHQAAGDFAEVLLDASVRQHAGGEEQLLEVGRGLRHRPVRKLGEHDDDSHGASQRRALCGRCADGGDGVPTGN